MDIKRMILKFNNIIDMKYFYDIYLFILSLITILGFIFNSYISISLILISL